ncbi:PEP/pyruvate-binding domain-containing protein [Allokutzneria sp. A3M-2-11 16]|uniref:PEP/pyruvate-binding domain-containing protein n=1 Tax=Allokutzneria sp. A3M-2-11 16 TaxID=2962043 RepID=UPI0020B8F8BA|nr:PEP/pyruvate-binding domain-containing protein [Allokutzneria sp. A3M-2-11 16]MCP3800183.1 PEP/pyruvate-binding domain-containing protein [Allokutzneria sp. A3M-2-11 16]
MPRLVTADLPALLDPSVVGHRFARQAALRRQGFGVPAFFCVPASALEHVLTSVLDRLGVPPPHGYPDLLTWSESAGKELRATGVDDELAFDLRTEFDRLVGVGGVAAVRACVFAGHGDSFEGISNGYLYVPRHELADRVADCYASVFSPQALLHATHRGMDLRSIRVAVGVQRTAVGQG